VDLYKKDNKRELQRLRLWAPDNNKLLVFVHGVYSGYLKQWHGLHKDLESGAAESVLANWNFTFLGYDTDRIKTISNIAKLIGTECRAAARGYARGSVPHRTFAFVGFSLGTLGIRHYLADCNLHPKNCTVRSVSLFGSPLYGSFLANAAAQLAPGNIFDQLSVGSATIAMLEDWSRCAYAAHPWPKNSLFFGVNDGITSIGAQNLRPWDTDSSPADYVYSGHSMKSLVRGAPGSELLTILERQLL
jgi:hypothetical protein